jgi:hypothetical protein
MQQIHGDLHGVDLKDRLQGGLQQKGSVYTL